MHASVYGTLEANGNSIEVRVRKDSNIKISVQGTFGGGTASIQTKVAGTWYPLLDSGVAVAHTVADDSEYRLKRNDEVRIVLTGATSPALDWQITGY